MPKQCFTVMACDSKLHAIILWHVISVKLKIGKKITGLEILTLNCKKFSIFPNLQNWCLRGSHTVYRYILESRGHLNLFKMFLCAAHTDVFTSKHNTMDFYKSKLCLTWSCKWIIYNTITGHTCWSVGMWLTCHIKFCTCNKSITEHTCWSVVMWLTCHVKFCTCDNSTLK